jgi:hypothetical protein
MQTGQPKPSHDPHAQCPNRAWQWVMCDRCRRLYICTPSSDYYCAAEGDHCCEPCLLAAAGITELHIHQDGDDRG